MANASWALMSNIHNNPVAQRKSESQLSLAKPLPTCYPGTHDLACTWDHEGDFCYAAGEPWRQKRCLAATVSTTGGTAAPRTRTGGERGTTSGRRAPH